MRRRPGRAELRQVNSIDRDPVLLPGFGQDHLFGDYLIHIIRILKRGDCQIRLGQQGIPKGDIYRQNMLGTQWRTGR